MEGWGCRVHLSGCDKGRVDKLLSGVNSGNLTGCAWDGLRTRLFTCILVVQSNMENFCDFKILMKILLEKVWKARGS